jgi:hypothetical protein
MRQGESIWRDYVHANQPSLLFCRGIRVDGSCFNEAMPAFQAEGYVVNPAQCSLDITKLATRPDADETSQKLQGKFQKTALLDKIKVRGCNGIFAVLAPSWA